MIQVHTFPVNMLSENTYVVFDETKEAVIIDCGALLPAEHKMIDDYIAEKSLTIKHLLQTHAHFDHLFGAQHIYETYGVKPKLSKDDLQTYLHATEQMEMFMHRIFELELPPYDADFLQSNTPIRFGNHSLRIFPTPGHTPGGVCLYEDTEHLLFSGDSLFRGSIGRTDLPGGNTMALVNSLTELLHLLPEDTKVYPGHGPETTIAYEKQYNGYLTI